MGLFQFRRMPFGLTGAPSSFQRLVAMVLRGLSSVTIYLDDILIHSATEEKHCHNLQEVFRRLTAAGQTLRGKKCHIGMKAVFLKEVYGSRPQEGPGWPTPTDSTAVRQFLSLASYYRRYIHRFADIAGPLHALTQSTRRPRNLLAPAVAHDVTKSHGHFPTSCLHPVITHPC